MTKPARLLRSAARSVLSTKFGLIFVALLVACLTVQGAQACDHGPGMITVERQTVDSGSVWQCIGSYGAVAEFAKSLTKPPPGTTALHIGIGPGTYPVEDALVLDGRQWRGVHISIEGAGPDQTTLIGSVSVGGSDRGWTIPLQPALVNRYLAANHSAQASSIPHEVLVYDGNERVVPGRWPKTGWGEIAEATREGDLWRLRLSDGAGHPAVLAPGPLRLNGFPGFDWAYTSVPAQAVSTDTVTVSVAALHYPAKARQRVTLEAAHGPDVDPRITVDLVAGTMNGVSGPAYRWARTPTFLKLAGITDVKVAKLGLMEFSGDAITVGSSTGVTLSDLALSRIGGRGVVITDGKRILVDHPRMRFMGEGGVDAGGGDRITLEPSDITISNGEFERFSDIVMTYRPAVHVYGVGAKILNNRMHDAPHSAIIFEGNDHLIKGNVIYDVVKEARDSGAIYTARDWTTYGTVIEQNVLAHLRSRTDLPANGTSIDTNAVRGIYLDDFTSGITIRENLFYEVDYAVFLNGGSDVKVTDNFFVKCEPPFAIYPWGLVIQPTVLDNKHRAIEILNALREKSAALLERNPRLNDSVDSLRIPKGDVFDRNTLISSTEAVTLQGRPAFMDLSNAAGSRRNDIVLPDPITSRLSVVAWKGLLSIH